MAEAVRIDQLLFRDYGIATFKQKMLVKGRPRIKAPSDDISVNTNGPKRCFSQNWPN